MRGQTKTRKSKPVKSDLAVLADWFADPRRARLDVDAKATVYETWEPGTGATVLTNGEGEFYERMWLGDYEDTAVLGSGFVIVTWTNEEGYIACD